ncbi:MAG: hypothetical protein RIQ40_924 [Planctomycetota bacterium]|jgi:hypothetical protein
MSDASTSGRLRWFASSGFGMFTLGVAIALGFAFAAQSVSRAMITMRTASTIKVKGTASVDVVSDQGQWTGLVSARGATLPEAYGKLNANLQRLQQFIVASGFAPEEITVESVQTEMLYARDLKGNASNRIESYVLGQEVVVQSGKVKQVKSLAEKVTDLIKDGVEVRSAPPMFTVSSTDVAKNNLLAEATRNALERAETLANGSGSKVGALQSASQGVIQILPRGSISNNDGSDYSTTTIDKTMRAVVSLEYAVER